MQPVIFRSTIPESLWQSRSATANKFRTYLRDYQSLLNATSVIDFGCNFNGSGCSSYPDTPQCCCFGCRSSLGYLRDREFRADGTETPFTPFSRGVVIASPKTINTYNRLFDADTGFWKEGVGCVLPREIRSSTCVFYNCLYKLGKAGKKRSTILAGIIDEAQKLRRLMPCIIRDWKKSHK